MNQLVNECPYRRRAWGATRPSPNQLYVIPFDISQLDAAMTVVLDLEAGDLTAALRVCVHVLGLSVLVNKCSDLKLRLCWFNVEEGLLAVVITSLWRWRCLVVIVPPNSLVSRT